MNVLLNESSVTDRMFVAGTETYVVYITTTCTVTTEA